jgi:hypothetical protein
MKKMFVILMILSAGIIDAYSQNISCQELFEIVTTRYESKESVSCYGSSLLVKADKYVIDNKIYVVAFIKKNDYDFKGTPYIFCGIPSMNWGYFKYNSKSSWGESYHAYLKDYSCNCN